MDGRQMHTQNINEQNIMNPETQHEKLLEDINDQLAELSLNTSAAIKKNDIFTRNPVRHEKQKDIQKGLKKCKHNYANLKMN